jgi:hypothetical protein
MLDAMCGWPPAFLEDPWPMLAGGVGGSERLERTEKNAHCQNFCRQTSILRAPDKISRQKMPPIFLFLRLLSFSSLLEGSEECAAPGAPDFDAARLSETPRDRAAIGDAEMTAARRIRAVFFGR